MKLHMELGSWRSTKHIEVIGEPIDFCIRNRQSAREVNCFSEYIKGEEAFKLWSSLRQLFEKGNKKEFVDLAVEIYNSHRRIGQGETK